jgi:uncharacterized protein
MNRLLAAAFVILSVGCANRSALDLAVDYMALYHAVAGQDDLLVKALLDRGAPVNAPDVDSAGALSAQAVDFDSPLQVAARSGNVELVRLLLQHHPWVDHRCCDTPAALGYAAEKGHAEIVQMLLDAGADPTILSTYDAGFEGAPVDAARKNGHAEVVRLLATAMGVKSTSRPTTP